MTKEDKLFFTGLFKGHDRRFDDHDRHFERVDKRLEQIDRRFDTLEEKVETNSRGIRYNGIMIEHMQEDIKAIRSMDTFFYEMNAKIDATLESVGIDVPAIKKVVSNNSRRITVLEANHG